MSDSQATLENCSRCGKIIPRDAPAMLHGDEVLCAACYADIFGKGNTAKPVPAPPRKATCSECNQAIVGQAKVRLFRGRVVCSSCAKKLEEAASPATPKQIEFLRSLGFPKDVRRFVLWTVLASTIVVTSVIVIIVIFLTLYFTLAPKISLRILKSKLIDNSFTNSPGPDESWSFGEGEDSTLQEYLTQVNSGRPPTNGGSTPEHRMEILYDMGDRATLVAQMTLAPPGYVNETTLFTKWRGRLKDIIDDSEIDIVDKPLAEVIRKASNDHGKMHWTIARGKRFETTILAISEGDMGGDLVIIRLEYLAHEEPEDVRNSRNNYQIQGDVMLAESMMMNAHLYKR